ncbi:MAG TPA: phospholipid carrier-dependent glycosyltransferase, partial [Chloroflexi bacterium]|nr:phospholipid carrier-dependent glycosyltransferase [Chloroflexota bacterium]
MRTVISTERTKMMWGAALLLLCLFAQAIGFARSASITFDEGPHLAIGYATLRTGDFRLQPIHIHPPLANEMAAAPLLLQTDLPDPRSIDGWEIASLSAVSDAIVWQYPHPRRMAFAARFPIIAMTLLLGALVYRWATDLFGPPAGLMALFLLTFDPNIIAHGSLVTTDMAVVVWGTAALFLTGRYLRLARRRYLGMAGLALGAALASKVSAISLIPPIGLLCLIGPRRYSWRRRLAGVVMGGILAGITLWAVYGFEVGFWHSLPFPIPAITHLKIYQALREHYQLGHPAFLLGQNGEHGWWYYFPVAFLLKTPLPTMILLGVAGIRAVRWGEDEWRSGETICRWGPMTIYPLLYLISSLFSSVNIGYRHLLPLLPFAYIAISQVVNWKWPPLGRLVLQTMLVWLLWGTVRLFPDYLAFFNALAGGAEGGYRYLVDSNLDWGQNLWQLRDWMDEQHVERVYYA